MPQVAESETVTPAATIIAMEKAALDRWAKGDPDGFLAISSLDVTYFDTFVERRVDGRDALKKLYDGIRGKVWIDRYELINPKVRVSGNLALLTFNFVSYTEERAMRWNTTEVYEQNDGTWRIVHSHWSSTQPKLTSN